MVLVRPPPKLTPVHTVTIAWPCDAEPSHGIVLFKHHNPLQFTQEQLSDLLDASWLWFQASHKLNPHAREPFFLWNCLPRAGASQYHGHAQVWWLLGTYKQHVHRAAHRMLCTRCCSMRFECKCIIPGAAWHRAVAVADQKACAYCTTKNIRPCKKCQEHAVVLVVLPWVAAVTDRLTHHRSSVGMW